MLRFVDALPQSFRSIALQHLDRLLDEDRPSVEVRGDHVHGGASSVHAGAKSLLDRIHASFGVTVDRESLVSSLTKKVARQDRFLRTEKNTFGLRPEAR